MAVTRWAVPMTAISMMISSDGALMEQFYSDPVPANDSLFLQNRVDMLRRTIYERRDAVYIDLIQVGLWQWQTRQDDDG